MNKLITIIIAALCLISADPGILLANERALAEQRDKAERLRRDAVACHTAGDYDKAILCYRELLAVEPDNPLVMKDLMWAYWNSKLFEEAAEMAQKIIALRPSDAESIAVLARLPSAENRAVIQSLYLKAGYKVKNDGVPDAVTLYRQTAALIPGNKSLASYLLSGLWQMSNYREGAQLSGYLTAQKPLDTENWNWLGKMESCLGHDDAAIKAFRKSLEIDPRQPTVRLLIGRELVARRDFEQAIGELKPLQNDFVNIKELSPLLEKPSSGRKNTKNRYLTGKRLYARIRKK